ncbi:MAG TPA: hypothetical protein VIG69_10430 [Candidatus Methylomirabilis sp.]|jgi:hypothetical protein
MSHPVFVIGAVLVAGILYVLLPWAHHVLARYRAPRVLPCPETGGRAMVDVDARCAALTSAFGRPRLRARWCTLWPQREGCAQDCLRHPEATAP